jgi:hypothetical protein
MTVIESARVHVTGVVQGVGFRPFVYRLAAGKWPGRLGAQHQRRGRRRRGGRRPRAWPNS